MCGIFAYAGNRSDASQLILHGLKLLEYRGYDSWGVAVIPRGKGEGKRGKNEIVVKKRIGKIGDANVNELPSSSFGFGHTRWATHGGVTNVNAHPHLDCFNTIAVIHNGIVENYEQLKKNLIKNGHKFQSETDSEIIAHLIEEYSKNIPFPKAVQKTFNSLEGLNAIIAINTKEEQFCAVKNGSPLVIGFGKNENFLASDAAALLPYTKQVYFLEDNQMAIVNKDKADVFDVATNRSVLIKPITLEWDIKQSHKGNYPYFMLKEIHEQPDIILEIANSRLNEAMKMAEVIKKSHGAYLVGCGSAAYVANSGVYLFSKVAKRHVNFAVASEFSYHLDFLNDKSLVIALSQSGETMDTLEAVKRAKVKGAKIGAIVNVLGSTLYRIADYKLLIGAGPEKGVASTKALIGKLSHLILIAYSLAGKGNQGKEVLIKAAASSKKLLQSTNINNIKKLAKLLKTKSHMFVIGRGLSYPTSLETALKIKEISYIHAEGLAAGELKHGPLALIEKGTPCIVFAPQDETHGANLAGAMEMKARGGYIIGISNKSHEVFDYYIQVNDALEGTIIPNIIVGQLLGYYLSVEKDLDPDKPRNLAKSVTVK
ncbi:glutamine--fructose-6-phosphate transaminase (isomerizing) [Candidatus Gottesmanbacteria bacterium]|nr:glutamine--fructose-6-phosphate transaminase (isomerizing) [Candidatus Gottesmanbacteria bacterium]